MRGISLARLIPGRGATFILRRRRIAAAAAVFAVAAIFFVINEPAFVGASATKRQLPVHSVRRDNKAASLTFNAVSGGDIQPLIDTLARYKITATFFITGRWADAYPESVKALADAGHETANLSDDYAHMARLTAGQIRENIAACSEKIAVLTGTSPTLFRAPYGEYDDNVVKTVSSIGMHTIQWSVDSFDARGISPDDIAKRVTKNISPGGIILFHISAKGTPEALPEIIEYMMQNGYSIVPVSELLLHGDHTINSTGQQQPLFSPGTRR